MDWSDVKVIINGHVVTDVKPMTFSATDLFSAKCMALTKDRHLQTLELLDAE